VLVVGSQPGANTPKRNRQANMTCDVEESGL
jgi:hypothetical protein